VVRVVPYILKKKGKAIMRSGTVSGVLDWLKKNTSSAWDWNFRLGGYTLHKDGKDITETFLYDYGINSSNDKKASNMNKKR
jgi:hypothetical protein